MKIRSNYKDYYDGMSAYDDGYGTLYFRKTGKPESIDLGRDFDFPTWDYSKYHYETFRHESAWNGYLIGFAGVVYPVLEKITHDKKRTLFYDPVEAHKLVRPRYLRPDAYTKFFEAKVDSIALFEKYGPCWVIKVEHPEARNHKLILIRNPCLLDYGFQHFMDAHIAYNELNKFICNTRNPAMPIPEMSNDIKIESHGFDLKTSFRRAKSKKNG